MTAHALRLCRDRDLTGILVVAGGADRDTKIGDGRAKSGAQPLAVLFTREW